MAAIKSNDSLRFSEMKLIANGKTSACLVTPQSLSGDFIALKTPKQDMGHRTKRINVGETKRGRKV